MPKDEKTIEPIKPAEPKPTHRYFCDGCTGVAFYWVEQGVTPQTKFPTVCHTCGKIIGAIKPQNFIKL